MLSNFNFFQYSHKELTIAVCQTAVAATFTTRHAGTSRTVASCWSGTATATFSSWEYRSAWWTTWTQGWWTIRPQGIRGRRCPVILNSTATTSDRSLTSATTRKRTVRVYFTNVDADF